jgi:hypothetical protein
VNSSKNPALVASWRGGGLRGQVCALVKAQVPGACRVVAFDHNLRCASANAAGQSVAGGNAYQQPAHLVHSDYTVTGAPARVAQLAEPAKANDTWKRLVAPGQPLISAAEAAALHAGSLPGGLPAAAGERFAIVNVWRNVKAEPVQRFPLAVIEAKTVKEGDLSVFEIHYQDRVGENYFLRHHPRHRWAYYPAMRREEALVFKQWDNAAVIGGEKSAEGPPVFVVHSSFEDPTTAPDAPDRESIEVRCVVLFD